MKGICFICVFVALAYAINPFQNESWDSGDIFITPGNSLFYYLFRSRAKTADRSLVIWLNGGPGSSSAYGMLFENGPYLFNKTKAYVRNPYSWNENADLVFVDQPQGTGNSHVRDESCLCRNESCVAKNFFSFLLNFYEKFPEYKKRPLYVTGESYGGHYLPAICAYIHRTNNPDISLKGLAIGNGLTSLHIQAGAYPTYLYQHDLMNAFEALLAKFGVLICNVGVGLKIRVFEDICLRLPFIIGSYSKVINIYDIKANETYAKPEEEIVKFMHDPQIQKAIHSEGRNFSIGNSTISKAMLRDGSLSILSDLSYLVDQGVPTILYYGDLDYICNWIGGEVLSNAVEWKKAAQFQQTPYKDWHANNKVAGKYKRVDNYTFLIMYDAGHLAPLDKPIESLQLLQELLAYK